MPEIVPMIFAIGWITLLALIGGSVVASNNLLRRSSRGLLTGLVVGVASAFAILYAAKMPLRGPQINEGIVIFIVLVFGVYGWFTFLGLLIWIGLRRLGRGHWIEAAIVGMFVGWVNLFGLALASGGRERDFLAKFKYPEINLALTLSCGIGSLVAWTLVYRKRSSDPQHDAQDM
jgi:hypothetical protein